MSDCDYCGDPKTQHKGGTGGCRHCELGCARFVPSATAPVDEPQDLAGLERDLDELEATDPAVGVATARLDETVASILAKRNAELAALREAATCGWCDGTGVAPAERFGRDADGAPMHDENQPCPEGCEVVGWLQAERNDAADAERELVTLRAELAQRAEALLREQAEHAKTRQRLAQAHHRLEVALVARDERAVDRISEHVAKAAPTVELSGYDAWQCMTCGSRYRPFHEHPCGPLIAVRVSVTTRTEGATP